MNSTLIERFLRSVGFFSGKQPLRARRSILHADSAQQIELLESRKLLTVTYHGGALLTHVEAQNVFLGSDWQTNSTLAGQKSQYDQFVNTLVSGAYMDMLTNAGYGVGRGTSSTGAVGNLSLNKTSGITDASIRSDIQAMINTGQLQQPDANRLYVVFVEPGVMVTDSSGYTSASNFLGYHGAFAGQTATGTAADIHYAVIPYPGGVNPSPGSQGFTSSVDEQTSVTSHEVAEAVTDPNANYKALGWYDDRLNGEIGDLTRINVNFNGYLVQEVVNQNDQPIGPASTTTTLTAPQNVTASALTTTSASVTWNLANGAQGYRVLELEGSSWVIVATLGSSVTSATIKNLTPGSKVSFKVEAYSGTTVAGSQTTSVTLPSSVSQAPTLSTTILSSNSINLNWTAITGALSYNVFLIQGTHRVLLGRLNGGTSVKIVGLTPGTVFSFQVEAVTSSSVTQSNIVSVNTAAALTHAVAIAGVVNRQSNRG